MGIIWMISPLRTRETYEVFSPGRPWPPCTGTISCWYHRIALVESLEKSCWISPVLQSNASNIATWEHFQKKSQRQISPDMYIYRHIHTYIPLHTITYHYIPLHTITYHYIPLHTITYHYIPLHYITLHHITYIHMYIYIYTHRYR